MIHIKRTEKDHCLQLSSYLSYDRLLNDQLQTRCPDQPIDPHTYWRDLQTWQSSHSSRIYTILKDQLVLGTISLSHISLEDKTAKCGYWLASPYWGQGYGKKAFGQVLLKARTLGLKSLTGSIDKSNHASIRLWTGKGASLETDTERVYPKLSL